MILLKTKSGFIYKFNRLTPIKNGLRAIFSGLFCESNQVKLALKFIPGASILKMVKQLEVKGYQVIETNCTIGDINV